MLNLLATITDNDLTTVLLILVIIAVVIWIIKVVR